MAKSSSIKKQEALEKLNVLIGRIAALETTLEPDEAFTKWQHDTRAVLKHVFPDEKEYVKEFDHISYHPGVVIPGRTQPREWHSAFRNGLGSARAMLSSRLDEVLQFWPDDEPIPTVGSNDQQSSSSLVKASLPTNPALVFVIHGRQLLGEFHDFLRAIGLTPLEWSKARRLTTKPNPYTWEIVDTALSSAGAIVALLTPDDEARLREDLWSERENALEKEYLLQPRQNVLFEAGVAYGRAPQRTVLIRLGAQRPMSDLAGDHILQLDDSPQSRQAVADALEAAGCPVDLSGTDWFKAGTFSV